MKVFLGIIILCLSTLFSNVLAGKFSFRKEFYNDFYNFNNMLKQEISYRQTTLVSLIKENNLTDFYCVLRKYIESNEFEFDKTYLKKDEVEYFYNYLKILGTGDKNSQIEFLDKTNINILEKQKQSADDEKKYKVLYVKLGFLIGLILFVLVL